MWSTNHDVWTVPVAGGAAAKITTNPAADMQPACSPGRCAARGSGTAARRLRGRSLVSRSLRPRERSQAHRLRVSRSVGGGLPLLAGRPLHLVHGKRQERGQPLRRRCRGRTPTLRSPKADRSPPCSRAPALRCSSNRRSPLPPRSFASRPMEAGRNRSPARTPRGSGPSIFRSRRAAAWLAPPARRCSTGCSNRRISTRRRSIQSSF